MKPGLSTLIPVQDCLSQDYCLVECIESALAVSDEVVCADWKSTDGTREMLEDWAQRESRIKIVHYPAEEPRGLPEYNLRWMNYARERLSHAMMLHLDADEILDDSAPCHAAIMQAVIEGECRTFTRLNFWRDASSLIPDGYYLGRYVVRLGPSNYWLPCDEPRHPGESRLRDEAAPPQGDLRIFHMGFLRRPEAFYSKAKRILHRKFNRYDQSLEFAERDGKPQWESEQDFSDKLEPYAGRYPASVRTWLREHGFEI